jgi:hypothetical protein
LVFIFIIFRVYLTLVKAAILILKHATFLRLSNSPKSALAHADKDYQEANIDLAIQEYLMAPLPEHSVEQYAGFIMATNIGLFILAPLTITSHQAFFRAISVFSQNSCIERITR